MIVSLRWLGEFVDLGGLTPEEIARRLTFAGIEVESIRSSSVKKGLIIGQVKRCEPAPDSDHLHLTEVDCGPLHGVLSIVCGAPNVRAGLKVIVALPGAVLPQGIIRAGSIHGHPSAGMICSLKELGVDEELLTKEQLAGIEELPEDAEVGATDPSKWVSLLSPSLVIRLLPNRSDLYSLFNFAKEIGTLFNRKLKLPDIPAIEGMPSSFKIASLTSKCPQFSALIVKGVRSGPSPAALQDFLLAAGMRPINSIVDIANCVMLLTGQPLHMYDLKKLPKEELIVRDDLEGDLLALDGKSYPIKKGDIVITSAEKIMCLGGIMGAKECAVDERSVDIVIEAATFAAPNIRRTSLRLDLLSEAAIRFAHGIDPYQDDKVLALTCDLLKKVAGVSSVSKILSWRATPYEPRVIVSSSKRINDRLGTAFSIQEIKNALEADWIRTDFQPDGRFKAHVPSARIDLLEDCDLAEEVIRIIGHEHVKGRVSDMAMSLGGIDEDRRLKLLVERHLRGLGLDEQLTYTLVRKDELSSWNFFKSGAPFRVLHPLTDEHEYVRSSLLPSLIDVLKYNLNRGNEDLAFFEVSDIFTKDAPKRIELTVILAGNDLRREHLKGEPYGYYHAKGIIEGLLDVLLINKERCRYLRSTRPELHPGRSADLLIDGKLIACFGEIHPERKRLLALGRLNVVVLAVDLSALFGIRTGQTKAKAISRFPSIRQDLAFLVDQSVSAAAMAQAIKAAGHGLVLAVDVFDVYEGAVIEEGKRSLAFRVTYGSLERTLKDVEVVAVQKDIIAQVKKRFGAELRR